MSAALGVVTRFGLAQYRDSPLYRGAEADEDDQETQG